MQETLKINGSEYQIERAITPGFAEEGQRLLVLATKAGKQFGLVFAQIVNSEYVVDYSSLIRFKGE